MMKKKTYSILVIGILSISILFFSGCIETAINDPPKSSFTMDPLEIHTGETIFFNSTSFDSDGSITNYTWFHDDKIIGHSRNITHVFQENGSHIIKLVVQDNKGATDDAEKNILIGDLKLYYENLLGTWEWSGDNQTGEWIFYENNTLKSTFTGIAGATTTDYWTWELWLNTSQILFKEPSSDFYSSATYGFEFLDNFSTLKVTYGGNTAYWHKKSI